MKAKMWAIAGGGGVVSVALASQAFGFENAKVLPKGVRNLNLRSVSTTIDEKTNQSSESQPLSEPLARDLTFKKLLNGKKDLERTKLQAFMLAYGFNDTDVLGTFTADLQGRLDVLAAVGSYGITDKITLAVALPYYHATTNVGVGFKPGGRGNEFVAALTQASMNQFENAYKYNDTVGELQKKLIDNGYQQIGPWEGEGLGDLTIAAKALAWSNGRAALAFTGGVVAPTGRVDDPDNLTDLAFGDGQWDAFAQVAFDQTLGAGFSLNEYGKYTYQFADEKDVRLITDEERIEVDKDLARYKLGDKWETGISINFESYDGINVGLGLVRQAKFGDRYVVSGEPKQELEEGTDQWAVSSEARLAYSTIPAFQRKDFMVPLSVGVEYRRHEASKNYPIANLLQVDASLFF